MPPSSKKGRAAAHCARRPGGISAKACSTRESRGGGGAISTGGTTTLQRVVIADNFAPGGGGIQSRGHLTIRDSYIHDNRSTSSFGGGISHFNRTTEPNSLRLYNVTLARNWGQQAGGGIAFMTGDAGLFSAENVTFSDNAAQKGASPDAWRMVRSSPGLEDLWQLHYSEPRAGNPRMQETGDVGGKDLNVAEEFIANRGDKEGFFLKLSAAEDGSFAMMNGRTGVSKTYPAR